MLRCKKLQLPLRMCVSECVFVHNFEVVNEMLTTKLVRKQSDCRSVDAAHPPTYTQVYGSAR